MRCTTTISIVILFCLSPPAWSVPVYPTYTGQLVWEANETQINANDGWADTSTKIEFEVEQVGEATWTYTYTLTVANKDMSHFIIETSESLDEIGGLESSEQVDWYGFGSFNGQGGSNPEMPEAMYGIKFELGDGIKTITVSFTVGRDPIWGDFYVKDGVDQEGEWAYAYNTGFTPNDVDPDPFDPNFGPDSELVTDHILVPDTIPEPAAMTLVCLGGVAVLLRRRKR